MHGGLPGEIRQAVNGSNGTGSITWPESRRFAFTIMDDPDGQHLPTTRLVYSFLADLGFRTTIATWPLEPQRQTNSGGPTCADPQYRALLQQLKALGFEIGFHNAAPHSATREETLKALELFEKYFGAPPATMANHYNQEAIYWGPARLTGWRARCYKLLTYRRKDPEFFGHVAGHAFFWGDICRERIRYCRNFVYSNINTLRSCPWMPYSDPIRPYVRHWFSASEGAQGPSFVKTIQDRNQERLEEEGGASIMYTHFGHGFVNNGKLDPEFRRLMERLARRNGWFVPVSTLLDFLRERKGAAILTNKQRALLETRWLCEKLLRGTS
ncbi:MAG: hypothetical protein HYX72_11555 [Acidobacteria bacterium]|nr:hypothetical protein [Acidobacteriota bacterium]